MHWCVYFVWFFFHECIDIYEVHYFLYPRFVFGQRHAVCRQRRREIQVMECLDSPGSNSMLRITFLLNIFDEGLPHHTTKMWVINLLLGQRMLLMLRTSEFTLGVELKKRDFNESRRIPIPITGCGAAKQWLCWVQNIHGFDVNLSPLSF